MLDPEGDSDADLGRLDEESLVDILTLLQGTNLRSAGRTHTDGGGGDEFVFSVDHRPGDDVCRPSTHATSSRAPTTTADVIPVESGPSSLNHREGTLLACIRDLEAESEPVIEVYVACR